MSAYVHAAPFAFYPILTLLIALLFALGIMPKLGAMKKAFRVWKRPERCTVMPAANTIMRTEKAMRKAEISGIL